VEVICVDTKTIGYVIRQIRLRRGLTQEVLSGLAQLDRTHYSKIERGLRSPTMETIFKIAGAIGMRPHLIVKEIEEEVERRGGAYEA